jgi:hypothetical protein
MQPPAGSTRRAPNKRHAAATLTGRPRLAGGPPPTAPPMNFSTRPPCRSTSRHAVAQKAGVVGSTRRPPLPDQERPHGAAYRPLSHDRYPNVTAP